MPSWLVDALPAIAGFLLSTIIPLGIFIGRSNIRAHRYEIVRDLENLFNFARGNSGAPLIIPSFELVKYKYKPVQERSSDDYNAHGLRFYLIPVLVYVGISSLGFITCFDNISKLAAIPANAYLLGANVSGEFTEIKRIVISQAFTFIGGYIWTIHYLLRRIANFDLSPISFFRSAAHIVNGLFVSAVLFHTTASIAGSGWFPVGCAFLIGLFPDIGLHTVIAKYPGFRLKRVSPASKGLQEELPLDTILGIDPFIKFRLAEFEIEDVQNLATINPIQIFVETPYGLYEVIDWVAQAQLILAVGSAKAARLRKMNVRTIFDLEKCIDNKDLLMGLLDILAFDSALETGMGHSDRRSESEDANSEAKRTTVSAKQDRNSEVPLDQRILVEALVSIVRDDLHVKRLRQIWDVIASRVDNRPDVSTA